MRDWLPRVGSGVVAYQAGGRAEHVGFALGFRSSPHARETCGEPGRNRRCAASTAAPAAASQASASITRLRIGSAATTFSSRSPSAPMGIHGSFTIATPPPGPTIGHPTNRITAPPNRIRLAHSFFDEELIEHPDRHHTPLQVCLRQPRARVQRHHIGAADSAATSIPARTLSPAPGSRSATSLPDRGDPAPAATASDMPQTHRHPDQTDP
jgi:hypothetical protein